MDEGVERTGSAAEARAAVKNATSIMVRTPWGMVPLVAKTVLTHCLRGPMRGWAFQWLEYPEGTLQILGVDLVKKEQRA